MCGEGTDSFLRCQSQDVKPVSSLWQAGPGGVSQPAAKSSVSALPNQDVTHVQRASLSEVALEKQEKVERSRSLPEAPRRMRCKEAVIVHMLGMVLLTKEL